MKAPVRGHIENIAAFGLEEPVETTQHFFNWFATVEEEMERGQEEGCRYSESGLIWDVY